MTDISNVSSLSRQVIAEVERAVVGKRDLLEMMMSSVLAGGHILLEDFPGLGKTLVARSFARVLGLEFKRIQFTPDLLPGDITGGYIFNRTQNTFELRKGPIFANIILADEINRASPKTQSALLEAMQEGQVTIEGETLPLPNPFLVLATQNPIEYEGTFPLPEAQLDRFMLKLTVGYPSIEEEKLILKRRRERRQDEVVLREISHGGAGYGNARGSGDGARQCRPGKLYCHHRPCDPRRPACGSRRQPAWIAGIPQDRPGQCRGQQP